MRSRILLCLVLIGTGAHADKGVPRIDLDNGVAITGNGQSIRTNPAALPDFRHALVDVAAFERSDFGVRAQMSTNLTENIGIGVAMDHLAGQTVVSPGFGFTTGKFSAGRVNGCVSQFDEFRRFHRGASLG